MILEDILVSTLLHRRTTPSSSGQELERLISSSVRAYFWYKYARSGSWRHRERQRAKTIGRELT
jgi:hypothetical protein